MTAHQSLWIVPANVQMARMKMETPVVLVMSPVKHVRMQTPARHAKVDTLLAAVGNVKCVRINVKSAVEVPTSVRLANRLSSLFMNKKAAAASATVWRTVVRSNTQKAMLVTFVMKAARRAQATRHARHVKINSLSTRVASVKHAIQSVQVAV